MQYRSPITILVIGIILLSLLATCVGIFSSDGGGPQEITSVRGETVTTYGKGIYKHMSKTVAPQGIAQDVVTLAIGVPLLLISLLPARKGSFKGQLLLTGTLGYFLVTYLFYLVMGMYNQLFLVWVLLLSASFFAFALNMLSFDLSTLPARFRNQLPNRFIGGFLIFSAVAIGLLWLSIVLPHTLSGTIPPETEHYTTLIVQGLDLSLLLPLSFLSGLLLIRHNNFGYLLAPVYSIFLAIMMTALTGKIIGQVMIGADVGLQPMILIPLFNLTAISCAVLVVHNAREVVEY